MIFRLIERDDSITDVEDGYCKGHTSQDLYLLTDDRILRVYYAAERNRRERALLSKVKVKCISHLRIRTV